MPTPTAAIILAAGQGTRMNSTLPKVMHPVCGRRMLDRAIDTALGLDCAPTLVVCGAHNPRVSELVKERLGQDHIVIQDPPQGTGHAVMVCQDALKDFTGDALIFTADAPLIRPEDLEPMFTARRTGADLVVLGFNAQDANQYGRLVTDGDTLQRIVEHKDATDAERAITTCNAGVYLGNVSDIMGWLSNVTAENANGEFYLTDIVALANAAGKTVKTVLADEQAVLGVNSRQDLAVAEGVLQNRLRQAAMAAGVTLQDPETVYLCDDTHLEKDVVIEPNVVFGSGVTVEQGARIRAFSHLEGCYVSRNAVIGPYARLRPKADIGPEAHIGNFVEVKNASIGEGAKANHLSYIGDGAVGPKANIGAGTIFCNYDGFEKHKTIVGKGAFVGSNSALVAPVTVGDGAYVGSGSVITTDVPNNALALARAVQTQNEGWAERYRTKKAK